MPTERRYLHGGLLLVLLATLLVIQSAWLGVTASPDLFYVANVFLHVGGGLVLAVPLLATGARWAWRTFEEGRPGGLAGGVALLLFSASLLPALALVLLGRTRDTEALLWVHILLAVLACLAGLAALVRARNSGAGRLLLAPALVGAVVALVVALGLPLLRSLDPDPAATITNPRLPPPTMAGEAMGGADGPFFPSASRTSTGGRIPSDFFLTSESCGRAGCHPDILAQWRASAHHFSSFNNQWYRKSIEYMQEVAGTQPSKWCGGCHDHAVLFNGMMDRPIREQIQTPEAQAGLGCNSCHAIVAVKDTMGNGGFFIEYPPLHDLAVSDNPALRWLHDAAVHLDPGPHRRVFLKPFHRAAGGKQAEFCSSCHKVHLDRPVNSYRWVRGFNEYDNWQASGVSGQGARSFYYPPEPRTCGDCHLVRVPSDDAGNIDGTVHDHRFLAANTAVPLSKGMPDQALRVIEFLQARQVTVDIFSAGPARPLGEAASAEDPAGRLATSFAVGEEVGMTVGRGGAGGEEALPLWGPLDTTPVEVHPGEEVRVDVVVRTRGVGHFFPGGTVDGFDVWLELRATGPEGRPFYWSGAASDNGRGPVDPEAHFYRARMIDGHGNVIDKRNAWAMRALVYVNLIPPGAADTVHYRLRIPEDLRGEITLEARLNYRKFSWENTRFAFAGRPAPGEPEGPGLGGEDGERVNVHWDDREFVFDRVPEDVSAVEPEIPTLPIVVMAQDVARLHVVASDDEPRRERVSRPADEERWNDYGIGLLRQGDLRGAARAFRQVISLDPDSPEGYVNVARAQLREGDLDGAEEMLRQALERDPDLAKSHYFTGLAAKSRGEYERALAHFGRAAEPYPRDRVVLNAIGRVHFLQRDFEAAVEVLQRVLEIDPEDLNAHYTLMLARRGLGDTEGARRHQVLYERFKADEDSQAIVGPYLRDHPEDNRERQPIHEHPGMGPETLDREWRLRQQEGEPWAVLPGQASEWIEAWKEGDVTRLAGGR